MTKKYIKPLCCVLAVAIALCGFAVGFRKIREGKAERQQQEQQQLEEQKQTSMEKVRDIAAASALEDVSVSLRNAGRYYADITCSNWGNLTSYEMLSVYQKMNEEVRKAGLKVGDSSVSLGKIRSGENVYVITLGSSGKASTIERNDKTIYEVSAKMKSSGSVAPRTSTGSRTSGSVETVPQEYQNALVWAQKYFHDDSLPLSKKQIRDQLEYQGFPSEAINYAIQNLE